MPNQLQRIHNKKHVQEGRTSSVHKTARVEYEQWLARKSSPRAQEINYRMPAPILKGVCVVCDEHVLSTHQRTKSSLGYCHRDCTNQVIRGEAHPISPRVASEACPFSEVNLAVSPSTPNVEMRDAAVKLARKAAKALLFPGNASCFPNHDVKLMGQKNSVVLRLAAEEYFNSRPQSAGSA